MEASDDATLEAWLVELIAIERQCRGAQSEAERTTIESRKADMLQKMNAVFGGESQTHRTIRQILERCGGDIRSVVVELAFLGSIRQNFYRDALAALAN